MNFKDVGIRGHYYVLDILLLVVGLEAGWVSEHKH